MGGGAVQDSCSSVPVPGAENDGNSRHTSCNFEELYYMKCIALMTLLQHVDTFFIK